MINPGAHKHTLLKVVLSIAFVFLMVGALSVVFLLPSVVVPPSDIAPKQVSKPRPKLGSASILSPDVTSEKQAENKREAEKLLSQSLKIQALLESEGVRVWGVAMFGTSLKISEKSLGEATAYFDRQQHTQAIKGFNAAIGAFQMLQRSKARRFTHARDMGKKFFESREIKKAISHLDIALSLNPEDDRIAGLLARAKKQPLVWELMAKGKKAEEGGEIAEAAKNYKAAVTTDPDALLARTHLKRVLEKIADRDFKSAITEALAHLGGGDFKKASRALSGAKKIRPKSLEVDEISKRIKAGVLSAALNKLRVQGAKYEKHEQWKQALDLYKTSLQIDRNAGFAGQGLKRARNYMKLHNRIDQYLLNPMRLYSSEPLADAKRLVEQVLHLEPVGHKLQSKKAGLKKLIFLSGKKVSLHLVSDKKTDVIIYRVGSFGKFEQQDIKLKPGKYTAQGSRSGYQDVHLEFIITPKSQNTRITIQCSERIN
jgi:tetratricopeptide (TPR) repeat protein